MTLGSTSTIEARADQRRARREEQAIDRKTSDRLAVRARQVDRQAGPDVEYGDGDDVDDPGGPRESGGG